MLEKGRGESGKVETYTRTFQPRHRLAGDDSVETFWTNKQTKKQRDVS